MLNNISKLGSGIVIGVSLTMLFAPPIKLLAIGYAIGGSLFIIPQIILKISQYIKS